MSEDSTAPDERLVEIARDAPPGDTRAFETLVDRHRGTVVANCRGLTRSPDDAEDLAQEVFVKAFFGLKTFEGRARFSTWVQRIKINHCLDFIEKRAGKRFVRFDEPDSIDSSEPSHDETPEHELLATDERERILAILDSLPDTLRVPLVMSDMDLLPYQEIADALGIGLSAVKMRIKRGRAAFRARFDAGGARAPSRRKVSRGGRAAESAAP